MNEITAKGSVNALNLNDLQAHRHIDNIQLEVEQAVHQLLGRWFNPRDLRAAS